MKKYLIIMCLSLSCWASDKDYVNHSAFEWGVGFLALGLNHYRGSDQSQFKVLPTPYFSYRSENLEVEPNLVRATFFKSDQIALKLSLMAGFNLESEANRAREQMEELDYTLEAGPLLLYRLWQSSSLNYSINFEWAIREVFKTNFQSLSPLGIYHTPYFNFIFSHQHSNFRIDQELSIGPMFNQKSIHQYYYDVPVQNANSYRPEFSSKGGYSGTQVLLLTQFHLERYKLISFLRWDNLNNAVFQNSPLVKQKHYFIFGGGLYWLF